MQFTDRPAYGQVVYIPQVCRMEDAKTRDGVVDATLGLEVSRNLLRFAVGFDIKCKGCGRVMDARAAMHFERKDEGESAGNMTRCCGCGDKFLAKWQEGSSRRAPGESGVPAVLEVIDGRRLWASRAAKVEAKTSAKRPPVSRNPVHKKDVKVGGIYLMKVSGRLCKVRIDREDVRVPWGSRTGARKTEWHGTNLRTGRPVTVRSAAKLRGRVEA